jgi:hypothetical protein
MIQQPKFDYGDAVRATDEEHRDRVGAVVGITGSELLRTYTIEFGDGTDCEIAEEFLSSEQPS